MLLFQSPLKMLAALAAAVSLAAFSAADPSLDLLAIAKDAEADFDAALAAQVEAGLPEAELLEARILRALVTGDFQTLMDSLPEIDAQASSFRFGLDRTFMSERQLSGFADALRAIQAYQAGEYDAFDRHAARAFIDAPDYTQAFGLGDIVLQLRSQEARDALLRDFVVPMDLELSSAEGESKSLRDWLGDDKALLIDFWASWCGPCIRLMPELRAKAAHLPAQGVFVAAVNTDKGDQLEKANKVRSEQEMQDVPWLLDKDGGHLSGLLQIDSIPRMVLIAPDGKVLYNGHPSAPKLGEALALLDATLPE